MGWHGIVVNMLVSINIAALCLPAYYWAE